MKLALVPSGNWKDIEHLIRQACDVPPESLPLSMVRMQVKSGRAVLFAVMDGTENIAAGTFERREVPGLAQLVITTLAGERMDEWLEMLVGGLEKLAREWACDQVVCSGRPGWSKPLKAHGYTLASVTMLKEIT